MSALTGNTVASTYKSLLKTVDNDIVSSSLKTITDGYGNPTALLLDDTAVFVSGALDVTAGVKGLFFRNETSPTFQNVITTKESIFNPGNLTVVANTTFSVETQAEYYVLGDIINNGAVNMSGSILVEGVLYNYGAIVGSGPLL